MFSPECSEGRCIKAPLFGKHFKRSLFWENFLVVGEGGEGSRGHFCQDIFSPSIRLCRAYKHTPLCWIEWKKLTSLPITFSNIQCFFFWHTSYVGRMANIQGELQNSGNDSDPSPPSPRALIFTSLKYFANNQLIIAAFILKTMSFRWYFNLELRKWYHIYNVFFFLIPPTMPYSQ